ncbi:hypothetical protein M758_3G228600 [Ceratodon purpureus]|nr:hypothetical protein M758_3G228600 [Ceratodon purpureus]
MASSCIRQMASLSLRTTRVLAAPRNLKVIGLSSPSFAPAAKPWFRQAYEPLHASFQLAALPRPMLTGGRGRFSVFSQAVATTPETQAEAEIITEPTIPETTDDAPPPTLKTKKLTKRVKHIMEILDKEAVETANKEKDIPDIRPGDVIQLRVEVPENKRRVSMLRGIVISRRNAGINTTFRIRRVIAGVGVEMVFPLYSPNIKEIKVVDKRKVRRAKLFYLRDKIARLSSC